MSDSTDLDTIEETVLVRLKPDQATLPVDTASEITKGYTLINKLLGEVLRDKHIEEYIDEHGDTRRKTHYHPWTLELIKERRRTIEMIWKMAGGEALNEAKKESAKKMADMLFHAQEQDIKKRNKDDFIKIMEAEVDKHEES